LKSKLPLIYRVKVEDVRGVPFPDEDFEPIGLGDPQELHDLLAAQSVAREVLPFIDTRAGHWRYYLFAAPALGRGRPLETRRRLLRVLKQTESRAGIGRRVYRSFTDDARRSEGRLLDQLTTSFATGYGTATQTFWGSDPQPSAPLCRSAREYVIAEDYAEFFSRSEKPDRLRNVFRFRLIALRRNLAEHIVRSDRDPSADLGHVLVTAASKASASRALDDSERLLFFSWSLLQAFYGIADDGTADNIVDDDAIGANDADDQYFRTLAEASIKLLERLKTPGNLNQKQVDIIRSRLRTALRHKGPYQPPVLVWKLKSDGRRRRVFSSLRLFAYARLLRATAGPS
jgi:hypothetical protein